MVKKHAWCALVAWYDLQGIELPRKAEFLFRSFVLFVILFFPCSICFCLKTQKGSKKNLFKDKVEHTNKKRKAQQQIDHLSILHILDSLKQPTGQVIEVDGHMELEMYPLRLHISRTDQDR